MNGEKRREKLVDILKNSQEPVSGIELSRMLQVSRQIIVSDIALLRAKNVQINSTHKGYVLELSGEFERIYKVIHDDSDVEKELQLVVDMGGKVKDVFVYHKVYGVVRADMNICSRRDIEQYMDEIASGKSTLLKNVTSGYHYHTVCAPSEMILDIIQQKLAEYNFLAKLQEYEPIDFWASKN